MGITFLATLQFGVQTGIVIALLFSLGVFIFLNVRPQIEELGRMRGVRRAREMMVPHFTRGVAGTVIYKELGWPGISRIQARVAHRSGWAQLLSRTLERVGCEDSTVQGATFLCERARAEGTRLGYCVSVSLLELTCESPQDRLLYELALSRKTPSHRRWRALVVDFSNICTCDSTSLKFVREVIDAYNAAAVRLCFACISRSVRFEHACCG